MRILVPFLCLMSLSSCMALIFPGTITALAGMSARERREGAEREARMREAHAREAAVIRQRYNETMRSQPSTTTALQVVPLSSPVPTAPPLVALDPVRTPLRPR